MSLRLLTVVGVVVFGLAGDSRADEKVLAAASKRLEGTWQPTENVRYGEKTPDEMLKPRRTVVKGGGYENLLDGKSENTGKWKFVAVKDKVLHLDLTAVDGPNKGKTIKCIAEFVSDDEWRLCMPDEQDSDRPTEFTSKIGGKTILRTYKRVKE